MRICELAAEGDVVDHDCNQEESIREIKGSLKELVSEFRTEFRGVMAELTAALKDGREYRTRIEANDAAIKETKEVVVVQWGKISELGKRQDKIEVWKASVLSPIARIEEIQKVIDTDRGARKVLAYLPTLITFILTVIVLWDKIK
jgi:hypothetical protein